MHKKVLLVFLIFLLIGCKKIEKTDNYIEIVNDCLKDSKVTNEVSLGYKYYVPKGIKKIRDYDYNQVFKINDDYLYLYVDIISYYYKKDLKNNDTDGIYYYKPILYHGNKGYIKIKKDNNRYLVSIIYNYSKIEFYSNDSNLEKLIVTSSIILNSIKYNDVVIEKVLEGNLGRFSEFTYEVEKPDNANGKFSQYLEEYVQKEEKNKKTEQLPDE